LLSSATVVEVVDTILGGRIVPPIDRQFSADRGPVGVQGTIGRRSLANRSVVVTTSE
jgi:hypothetical protein